MGVVEGDLSYYRKVEVESFHVRVCTVLELFHLLYGGGIRVKTIGVRKGGCSLLGLGGSVLGPRWKIWLRCLVTGSMRNCWLD